jgi:hypothetical protein
MKRDRLVLSQRQSIETSKDWNGRYFIAYSDNASIYVRDVKELRRFLKIPRSIPMRASLESWLESLADMDAQKEAPKPAEVNLQQTWDPLADGLDQSDPQFQTRSVI